MKIGNASRTGGRVDDFFRGLANELRKITLAPEILAGLMANGHDVADIEYLPGRAAAD